MAIIIRREDAVDVEVVGDDHVGVRCVVAAWRTGIHTSNEIVACLNGNSDHLGCPGCPFAEFVEDSACTSQKRIC